MPFQSHSHSAYGKYVYGYTTLLLVASLLVDVIISPCAMAESIFSKYSDNIIVHGTAQLNAQEESVYLDGDGDFLTIVLSQKINLSWLLEQIHIIIAATINFIMMKKTRMIKCLRKLGRNYAHPSFQFGTGDFTIDCWITPLKLGDSPIIIGQGLSGIENHYGNFLFSKQVCDFILSDSMSKVLIIGKLARNIMLQ